MVPLKIVKEGFVEELHKENFKNSIVDFCEQHKKENRALAFAFLMYDFENPQINKIIEDKDYWTSLHKISGQYLSVFYINSKEEYFGEDLSSSGFEEKRGLYAVGKNQEILPVLKQYFELDSNVKLPSILFFQVDERMIIDYFLLNLDEEKVEDSFIELKTYIKEAVNNLKGIKTEFYHNSKEIFEVMKSGVEGKKFKSVLFKRIQKFPLNLLISWIIGKI